MSSAHSLFNASVASERSSQVLLGPYTTKMSITLHFRAEAETCWGQHLFVIGSIPELGEWQLPNAIPLKTSSDCYPTWFSSPVAIRGLPGQIVEYKYLKRTDSGATQWETFSRNRKISVPYLPCFLPLSPHFIVVGDSWNREKEDTATLVATRGSKPDTCSMLAEYPDGLTPSQPYNITYEQDASDFFCKQTVDPEVAMNQLQPPSKPGTCQTTDEDFDWSANPTLDDVSRRSFLDEYEDETESTLQDGGGAQWPRETHRPIPSKSIDKELRAALHSKLCGDNFRELAQDIGPDVNPSAESRRLALLRLCVARLSCNGEDPDATSDDTKSTTTKKSS